ncbi:hypothetical protein [Clostridium sp.]|uniref:hypothetical protein n=1 Tax=Clostridium sp. TaxID=1506 RepID=UPI00261491F7|nr:hypothetical protein [Clostridium sp.]
MIKAVIKQTDRFEVLKEFLEKYLADRWIDEFGNIDEKYKKNKDKIEEELKLKFESICKFGISLQEQGLKGEIKYIYFSVLRTSLLLKNKGEFRLDLYDERWFLDKAECSINISLDFIYELFFKHIEELKEKKKGYVRNIREVDIDYIMLEEANKYHILAAEFLKDIIENLLEVPAYKKLKKMEDIKIMAGEYMDFTEIIYTKQEGS